MKKSMILEAWMVLLAQLSTKMYTMINVQRCYGITFKGLNGSVAFPPARIIFYQTYGNHDKKHSNVVNRRVKPEIYNNILTRVMYVSGKTKGF